MKISDLAAIVTVRDRINIVMNGMRVSKADFKTLNDALTKLDKKFMEGIGELDFDNLFPPELNIEDDKPKDCIILDDASCLDSDYVQFTGTPQQLELQLEPLADGIWEEFDSPPDHPDDDSLHCFMHREQKYAKREDEINGIVDLPQEQKEAIDSEDAELALIAQRVKAQKELLRKEGRSNKRIPKTEDGNSK